MKSLTQQIDLEEIIRGQLSLERRAGTVTPRRFTAKQLAFYESIKPDFEKKSKWTSGICLDFLTDTRTMVIKGFLNTQARRTTNFDVYSRDVFLDSVECETDGDGNYTVSLQFPENPAGKQRITVYLPHLAEVGITEIEIDNGCTLQPAPLYSRNYLCLGGSISQGSTAKRPSSMYSVQLARRLGMNLINQGVGGFYFEAESLDEELPFRPDLITVAYGGNEGRVCHSIAEYEARISAFMAKLVGLYPEAKIFVIPPSWRTTYFTVLPIGTTHVEMAQAINRVCRNFPGVHVFDGLKLTPHSKSFYTDGVHPTDEGFLLFTLNILPEIARAMS